MHSQRKYEERLTGGHPNSLGATVEIVEEVLENPIYFHELFECYFSDNEVVRLRVSNAMKRITKSDSSIVIPYIDRFIKEISKINQASTQWTLSQLFLLLEKKLTLSQRKSAIEIMKTNLANHQDWIVLNETMKALGKWAKDDRNLQQWMLPYLQQHLIDTRNSVSKTAKKTLELLDLG